MVTRDEVRAPQTFVTIAAEEEVDPKIKTAMAIMEDQIAKKIEDFKKRMASIEAATPINPVGYQNWNCLLLGPYQTIGNPPYLPNKVVAGGQPCYMRGLVWVNQAVPAVGGWPASIVLGGRAYNLRFGTVDLTTVTPGPSQNFPLTFSSPALELNWQTWVFTPPDPGPTPHIYEVNLTMDVILANQPFAGFATWHYDPDAEIPFWTMPAQPAGWEFERPARFMVYHL
jgi:hypothetical protein